MGWEGGDGEVGDGGWVFVVEDGPYGAVVVEHAIDVGVFEGFFVAFEVGVVGPGWRVD